jgi:hypothetical protein
MSAMRAHAIRVQALQACGGACSVPRRGKDGTKRGLRAPRRAAAWGGARLSCRGCGSPSAAGQCCRPGTAAAWPRSQTGGPAEAHKAQNSERADARAAHASEPRVAQVLAPRPCRAWHDGCAAAAWRTARRSGAMLAGPLCAARAPCATTCALLPSGRARCPAWGHRAGRPSDREQHGRRSEGAVTACTGRKSVENRPGNPPPGSGG